MFNYMIGFNGHSQIIQAEDLWSAKQMALEIYKPGKRYSNLVWVELISEKGTNAQYY